MFVVVSVLILIRACFAVNLSNQSVIRISYYQTEINICDFNIELLINIYIIQITNVSLSLYLMLIVVQENTNSVFCSIDTPNQ